MMNPNINIKKKRIIFILLTVMTAINCFADTHDVVIANAISNPARSDSDRERDKTSKPFEVLSFFGVKPGMHILDLFSGGGYYSEILSYIVGGKGKVVAHTNKAYEQYVEKEIAARFKNNRLAGIERLVSEIPDMKLGEEKFDMVLMVMIYHDVYFVSDNWPKVERDNYFAQIHRSLKPGGTLAVIDHSAKPGTGNSAAQDLHRIDEEFAKQDIESAGFKLERQSEVLRNSDDDRSIQVFDDKIRRKTDRFIYKFVKS